MSIYMYIYNLCKKMYDLSQLSNDYIIPSCQNDLKLNCAQFHRAELGDFPARHV